MLQTFIALVEVLPILVINFFDAYRYIALLSMRPPLKLFKSIKGLKL